MFVGVQVAVEGRGRIYGSIDKYFAYLNVKPLLHVETFS